MVDPYSAMKVVLVEVLVIIANTEYILCARIRIMCWKSETENSSQYIEQLRSIRLINDYRLARTRVGKQFSLQWHRSFLSLACLYGCVLYENTEPLRSSQIEPRQTSTGQHAPDDSALSLVAKVILSTKQY